jgi:hypothetical protein
MAMTSSTVVGLGGLATLVAGAQFLNSEAVGRELKVLLAWLAVILWSVVGLSAFSVASEAYQGTQPMTPLVVVGFLMAGLVGVQALDQTGRLISERSGATEGSLLGVGR